MICFYPNSLLKFKEGIYVPDLLLKKINVIVENAQVFASNVACVLQKKIVLSFILFQPYNFVITNM